jgi:hypothetical protein
MTSVVFETARFRVHITGKAAWVEAKEGGNWVFRNWHALPASADCTDSDALKAAVTDYEEARAGNGSLRSALTGIRQEPAKPAIRQAKAAIAPASPQRPASSTRAKKSSEYYGFRAPLRPPLLRPAVATLGPNAPGN